MSATQLKQVFTTPDGTVFDTKAEAMDYLRKPQIVAALNKLNDKNAELTDWLVSNRDAVESAFEVGTITRVTKAEAKKLTEALDHIAEVLKDDKKAAFVVDAEVLGAIKDSFRWPAVKRMTDDEKATAARNTLVALSEGNEDLAEWILANRKDLLEAFQAGVEKRQVSPKAAEGLAAYRAKMAAEKAAKEAAEPAKA